MKNFIVMKGTFLILCLWLVGCTNERYADYSQSSGFDRTQIDSTTLENLEVLGRVWGYVKYHHPVFADDKYNIDYELFELLPRIADADRTTRNRVLTQWIDGLGEFTINRERYDTLPWDLVGRQTIDLSWTHDTSRLGAELSDRLAQLRYADRSGNYYVTTTLYDSDYYRKYFPEIIMPDSFEAAECPQACFENEKTYQELAELDYSYRLLTAFRFCNMIEYFFPSKYLIERPWGDVLPEYIQRMASLPDGDYTRTMRQMIAEIKDSHTSGGGVYTVFGYNRVPLYTAFAEGKLIVSRPDTACYYTPKGAGFHVGDEIVAVNGRPVSFYTELVRTYIPCSNEARVRDQTADIMLRTDRNTSMQIRYCRDGIERGTLADIDSRFMNMEQRDDVPYMDFGEGICYVNSGEYRSEDEAALISLFGNAKRLIVDLRNYPSPDFKILAMNSFLPDSLWIPLRSRYTYPELSMPLRSLRRSGNALVRENFLSLSSWMAGHKVRLRILCNTCKYAMM